MTNRSDRRVAVVSRADSLTGAVAHLSASGWTVVRVPTIATEPVRSSGVPGWTRRRPVADLWVVTSRAVVDTLRSAPGEWRSALRSIPSIVAVGPSTARALRTGGFERVGIVSTGGSRELLRAIGPVRGRRILHLRSDAAGPRLAQRLRRRGARVIDRVVYRVVPAAPARAAARTRIGSIPVWVVASPSALVGLRRVLGDAEFDRRISTVRLFAMGERTTRAARSAGARRVEAPSRSTEEDLTNLLEQALGDAPGPRSRTR